MVTRKVTLTIKIAWWLSIYIYAMKYWHKITGIEPDMDRIKSSCMKAVKIYRGKKRIK